MKHKLLKQALKAMEGADEVDFDMHKAIAAIKQYFEAPAAWMHIRGDHKEVSLFELAYEQKNTWEQRPLYFHPKDWVGLTNKDKQEIWATYPTAMVISATEAKLKEKNSL